MLQLIRSEIHKTVLLLVLQGLIGHLKCPECALSSIIYPIALLTDLSREDPEPDQSRSILILSFHLRQGLPGGLFPSGFTIKTLYTLLSTIRATCPAHVILLDLMIILSHSGNYDCRSLTTVAAKCTVVPVDIWVQLHPFLTRALDVSFTIPPLYLWEKIPAIRSRRGCGGPTAGSAILEKETKLCNCPRFDHVTSGVKALA